MSEHQHARPTRPIGWPETMETPAQFEFDLTAALARDRGDLLEEIEPGVYLVAAEGCLFCKAEESRGDGWLSGSC
jgi:hypothetical protein